MSYYGPVLPLTKDDINGYAMLDDLRDVVKQNFKMLILTLPGERVMLPEFGVGIYKFLFEPYGAQLNNKIAATIRSQAKRYLPYLDIRSIQFGPKPSAPGSATPEPNSLNIAIEYKITPLNFKDVLEINVNEQN